MSESSVDFTTVPYRNIWTPFSVIQPLQLSNFNFDEEYTLIIFFHGKLI